MHTMVSRSNSTSDIQRGLSHILLDAKMPDLPDDLESLEDCLLSRQVVFGVLLQQITNSSSNHQECCGFII